MLTVRSCSLDKEIAATASPGDHPTAADGPGSQRDTNVRQQVEGNGPATGKSVLDEQTRTTVTADALDPANAATGGHDRPTASGSPGVQGDTALIHWLTSPTDPAAADVLGAQRDTDFRQQVEGNGPATGKSVLDKQTRTAVTADALDPANAATGGLGHPTAPSSSDVQFANDVMRWLTSPTDPAAADVPGAQVEGNGPFTGTGTSVRDKQTPTTADASLADPVNAATEGHDRPTASSTSPGVQGDTDLIHWLTSPTDPTAADVPGGAQRDTDIHQQGNGSVLSDRDKAQETRTTVDTSDPVNTVTAAGQERPSAEKWIR